MTPLSPAAEQVARQAFLAKTASRRLALLSSDDKKRILLAMASAIEDAGPDILFRNEIDVEAARSSPGVVGNNEKDWQSFRT